jgi:hypothetical protein
MVCCQRWGCVNDSVLCWPWQGADRIAVTGAVGPDNAGRRTVYTLNTMRGNDNVSVALVSGV